MLWSQVGITLHHSYVRPTAKLLEKENRDRKKERKPKERKPGQIYLIARP
jgi:hypothetical protein